MTIMSLLAQVIGFCLIAESIYAAANMDGGDRLCNVVKYLFAACSGAILLIIPPYPSHIIFGLTISAFIWPDFKSRRKIHLRLRNVENETS